MHPKSLIFPAIALSLPILFSIPAQARTVDQLRACQNYVLNVPRFSNTPRADIDVIPGPAENNGAATIYWHVHNDISGNCFVSANGGEIYGYEEDRHAMEPERGVSCHREAKVCFDDFGPSVAFTEEYFGRSAANSLVASLDRVNSGANEQPVAEGSSHRHRIHWSDEQIGPDNTTARSADGGQLFELSAFSDIEVNWDDTRTIDDRVGREYVKFRSGDRTGYVRVDRLATADQQALSDAVDSLVDSIFN